MEVAWSTNNTASATWSGTSLSAPLAAGSAAAILSASPALNAAQLRTFLLGGASQVTVGNGQGVANRVLYSRITPPSVISASIVGPTMVLSAARCTYTAVASGARGRTRNPGR